MQITLTIVALASFAAVQSGGGTVLSQEAFLDPGARTLLRQARVHWEVVDRSIASYTALVRKRIGVRFRMPLKDRTIYRSEAATRVWWSADGPILVQALAAREQTPTGVSPPERTLNILDNVYDPAGDRIYFGSDFES